MKNLHSLFVAIITLIFATAFFLNAQTHTLTVALSGPYGTSSLSIEGSVSGPLSSGDLVDNDEIITITVTLANGYEITD
jgi:type IV secretory pathway VirB2 component (pilin)